MFEKENTVPFFEASCGDAPWAFLVLFLGGGTDHSFTLPAEIPLMMYLEKKQNAIMMGTAEIATTR